MTREVTPDEFDQIMQLIRQARTFHEAAKGNHLTLAQKLALQKHERDAREQAMAIPGSGLDPGADGVTDEAWQALSPIAIQDEQP